jgi:rhodanese-related sulfurtransferase
MRALEFREDLRGEDQMSFKKWAIVICVFILPIGMDMAQANVRAGGVQASTQTKSGQPKAPEVAWITAGELKAKIAKNEPVTIIDLRASSVYDDDNNRIKGAIRVKERKLRYRISIPPFKDLPRDRLIVTYCACQSDEIAVRAAQALLEAGFTGARVLKGGWQAWLKAGGVVESKPKV